MYTLYFSLNTLVNKGRTRGKDCPALTSNGPSQTAICSEVGEREKDAREVVGNGKC